MASGSSTGIELERIEANILGKGSFGVVYKGRLQGNHVAVKVINRHFNQKYWDKLQNEWILLEKSLRHPNIINILAYEDRYPSMPEVWIAMELCGDNLHDYLGKSDLADFDELDVLWQCAKGLLFLHENHLVHRDIKPDNFLLVIEGSSITVKVTDYSLSKDIEGIVESETTSIHGNTHWLAPELFDEFGRKARKIKCTGTALQMIDVFSFGIIVLYTCIIKEGRQHVWEKYEIGWDVNRGKDVLVYFEFLWKNDTLRQRITPMLKQMFEVDPDNRPTMHDVYEDFNSQKMTIRNTMTSNLDSLPLSINSRENLPVTKHDKNDCVISYNLPYKCDVCPSIGGDNHILLQCKDTETLRLVQLQKRGHREIWNKPCPQGFDCDANYILGETIISREWKQDPTRYWNLDLQLLSLHTIGCRKSLVGVLQPDTAVYLEETEKGIYQLGLYKEETRMMTLEARPGSQWRDDFVRVSVCRNVTSGWIAVCSLYTRSLDIYDDVGGHQYHISLDYRPGWSNAITCYPAPEVIVITEHLTKLPLIHFYNWRGEEIYTKLDLGEVVRLYRDETIAVSVGVCNGNVLHVAVGSLKIKVTSIHAITLND